ncbi:MAG TPA: hypothetical protein VLM75_00610 [Spirochaetota bacterium]|nr:hypothetical protein [Spirochaetota bacterium]
MRLVLRYIAVCTVALMVRVSAAPAADAAPAPPESEYSAEAVLGFARHLARRGEYFRAYTELSRLKSYYPGHVDEARLKLSELYLLYGGGRYGAITEMVRSSARGVSCPERIFSADAAIALGEYGRSLETSIGMPAEGCEPFIDSALRRRTFISLILLNRVEEAKRLESPQTLRSDDAFNPAAHAALAEYARDGFAGRRSPRTALALGAVPGMGYVYAGNRQNGALAFLVVSAFSALTYFSFRTDNAPLGFVFGASAAVFYGGGIVGAYRETLRYNRSIEERIRESVYEELRPGDDREEIFTRYGIGYGDR